MRVDKALKNILKNNVNIFGTFSIDTDVSFTDKKSLPIDPSN